MQIKVKDAIVNSEVLYDPPSQQPQKASATYPLNSMAVLCYYVDPHCGNAYCFRFLKLLNKAEMITLEHGDGCLNSKVGWKMKLEITQLPDTFSTLLPFFNKKT